MDEGQEVSRRLLVACRYPPVLLDLAEEPLHQVTVLVTIPVVFPLNLTVLLRRNHCLSSLGLDRLHQFIAIVALVFDHHLGGDALHQLLCLLHVGGLPRRQDHRNGKPQPTHPNVDLGAKSAPTAAEGFLVLATRSIDLFFAPAAWAWARMIVESRRSHSRSGSCNVSKIVFQTPFLAQRSKRRKAVFQLPKRSGRSRQGAPVLPIHSTASTNRRLLKAVRPRMPGRPGKRSWIRSHDSSEIAWRCRMIDPPDLEFLSCLSPVADFVHTT